MNQPLITPELVSLDVDFGAHPDDVITRLAQSLAAAGRTTDATQLAAEATAREAKSGTGVPGRVAIPHTRSATVDTPTLAFTRLARPVDFSGPDGAAELVFLIAAPEGGGKQHLKILSTLARALVRGDFVDTLRAVETPEAAVEAISAVVQPAAPASAPAAATTPTSQQAPQQRKVIRIAAVTSCPTGIAHTYMAADALTQAAAGRDDVELRVEPQGSTGYEPLDSTFIDGADAVIFAHDVAVRGIDRFAGKPYVDVPVKRGIDSPAQLIDAAVDATADPTARTVAASGASRDDSAGAGASSGESWPRRIQQAVMTGVSYMVPFVAAGGLLLALGFLFGGYDVANGWQEIATGYSPTNLPGNQVTVDGELLTFERSGWLLYLGAVLFATGQAGMGFVVAALSGYIAYGLAGRPGIAPGFIGGAISVMLGAGFIGGLVTGILAGLIALWIQTWRVPRWLSSLMPVVLIPLLTSLAVGLVMFFLLGRPLEAIMLGLQGWLESMGGTSAVALGAILGLMMCFDLGGPVNKAAYLFGTAGLSAGTQASFEIMAAVMISGMVPPIALSLATLVRAKLFTAAERENGASAWLLGLSFVSEGAIPFAAADPFRVIPSMMLGGATAGAVSMALSTGVRAPHGGIFVVFAYDPWWALFLSLAVGVAVSTLAVIAAKQLWPRRTQAAVPTA